MMMIGEMRQSHPTIQVPPWGPTSYDDPTATILSDSPSAYDFAAALHRYLPSNDDESDLGFDSFACDNFRMYEFKVRKCARGRSHDWTECPYAHPGEKARRRDPRKYHYSGTACPDFRKGGCRKGDTCEFAHGVFECWLHPARYRTQPCKDGPHCRRRVCFFAHSPDQLRVLPDPSGGSGFGFSPNGSPPSDSPPMSPCYDSVNELVSGIRGLEIGSGSGSGSGFGSLSSSLSPRGSWGVRGTGAGSGFGSPRSPMFGSMPTTPTRTRTRSGSFGLPDPWDLSFEEEPAMERVESGKDLRARIYAKLSMENRVVDRTDSGSPGPDLGWVSELVK